MITPYNYSNLGGGINQSAAKSTLKTSEMQQLKNFFPYGTKLRKRGGTRRINLNSPWSFGDGRITGIAPFRSFVSRTDLTWRLILAGNNAFAHAIPGSGNIPIPAAAMVNSAELDTALAAASTFEQQLPWGLVPYKNFMYAFRKGAGGMVRLDGSTARHAGLTAPTAASTIADGGAGALVAGDYQSVYTYYWSGPGFESDPSPVSNTLTLAGSRFIDHSGITVSPFNPPGMHRRVYRTIENGSDIYYLVATILDNTTTVLTPDQVAVDDLGDSVSFENGVPPSDLEGGRIWNDRMWATDGDVMWYSRLLLPEAMASTRFLPITPDDGMRITGFYPLGDRLLVFKQRGVHYIVGNSPSTFDIHTLNTNYGCDAPLSLAEASGRVFWVGNGHRVFQTDGVRVDDIGDPRVNHYLDDMPVTQKERIVGYIDPRRSWYVLLIPGEDTTEANPYMRAALIYDFKQGTWAPFEWENYSGSNRAPNFITEVYNEKNQPVVISTHSDGNLYEFHDEDFQEDEVSATYGDGSHYEAMFMTKPDDFGYPGLRKAHDSVEILYQYEDNNPYDDRGDEIQLELWYDNDSAARLSREVPVADTGWKPYKMPTWTEPGMQLALKFIYTGPNKFDVEQIIHNVGITARRPEQPV